MEGFFAILVIAVGCCAVTRAAVQDTAQYTCEVRGGTEMTTFSGHNISLAFPCKYHALKRTKCGAWNIKATPGAWLLDRAAGPVVMATLWVGIQDRDTRMKWLGNTYHRQAERYLSGGRSDSFTKRDSPLDTDETVVMGGDAASRTVWLTAIDGAFRITYGVPDLDSASDPSQTTFKFECFDDAFEARPYPEQLCGLSTAESSMPVFDGDYETAASTVFMDALVNDEVDQTNRDCRAAQRMEYKNCQGTNADTGATYRSEATAMCWPLVGKGDWQTNLADPIKTLKYCLSAVCANLKGKTDPNACFSLGKGLKDLPPVPGVCEVLRDGCGLSGQDCTY